MLPFYTGFRHTFTWVALESLTYYGLLSLHQIVLFRYTSPEIYGVIGTTYSLSYLCVYFLIAAFDKALAPFFARFTANRSGVRALFWYQAIPTYIIACATLSILFWAKPYLAPKFHYFDFISNQLFIVLAIKVILEITRKGIKTFLILTYQSHLAAIAEIIAMLTYIVMVWSLFLITGTITLLKVFIPLVIAIFISAFIMMVRITGWYRSLPATGELVSSETQLQFAKNRIATMGFHMNRLFFTTEFLVPFFAYKFGLPAAGILKLASKIVSTFTIIIRRVFETASSVMMANVRECTLEDRVSMFSFITNWINQVMYALIIFFSINHRWLFMTSEVASNGLSITEIAYAYLFLSLTDNLFIAYEQFYIAQERAHYLLGLNMLSLCIFIGMLYTLNSFSPIYTIISLAIIRLFSCILLGFYSYAQWRIKPSLQVKFTPLVGATALSILAFLIFG